MFYLCVILALQTGVQLRDAFTVAVFVTAALRWAVLPNKPEVTLTHSWRHAGAVDASLCAHGLTLTRYTVKENVLNKLNYGKNKKLLSLEIVKSTCWVHSPVCRCSDSHRTDRDSPEWRYSGGGHWHTRPPLGSAGTTSYCSTVGTEIHSHLQKQ